MEHHAAQLRSCMYQYSRAIYRSIKDLIDPYVDPATRLEYCRDVLHECEQTMERMADDPHYFARPDRALFADIRRYFPITAQAQVAWSVGGVRRASRQRRATWGGRCSSTARPYACGKCVTRGYGPRRARVNECRTGRGPRAKRLVQGPMADVTDPGFTRVDRVEPCLTRRSAMTRAAWDCEPQGDAVVGGTGRGT